MSPECQICGNTQVKVKKCRDCGILFCDSCGSTKNSRCRQCNRQYNQKRRSEQEKIYLESLDEITLPRE